MKQSELAIVANDRTMPEQYSSTFRRAEFLEPEKALLVAILQDAIDCYHKHGSTRDRTKKQIIHDAERWLMRDEDDWVFSFRNVCDLLGLDPQYIRHGLLEERRRQGAGARRRYKHRRHAA